MAREKKKTGMTTEEYLERDPVFQKLMADRAKEVSQAIYGNMMPILKGNAGKQIIVEELDATTGKMVEVIKTLMPTPDERVRAGKLLKEAFIDKKMADKRDSGQTKGKGEGNDHEKALKTAEDRILRQKDRISKKKLEMAPADAVRRFPATVHDFEKGKKEGPFNA